MVDEGNQIIAEHNVGDIVAIKFRKTKDKEARMNVTVGEIVSINSEKDESPVLVHLYGPYPRKNLATAAHKAAWSPRIRTEDGDRLAKDLQGSKRLWKGKRVLEQFKFNDLLAIPPLELKCGTITNEGQSNIRKILKGEVPELEEIRVMRPKNANASWNKMCSWLAHNIRTDIEQGWGKYYNNEWYIQNAYIINEDGYAIRKAQQNRKKPERAKLERYPGWSPGKDSESTGGGRQIDRT